MGKKITLKLQKGEETKELQIGTGMFGLAKAIRPISKALKEGWELVDVSGDDPKMVGVIQGFLSDYRKDPEHFQVEPKALVKTAFEIKRKDKKEPESKGN